ncbi:MAG TPA: type II and III secretion system protein [Bryobacteraceae bacterium]|nr:type II and III secretion system protein [Bryobacteraceae bacterium]
MALRAIVLSLLAAAAVWAAEPTAAQLYAQGRKAEAARQFVRAYVLYSAAAAKEPGNRDYWMKSQTLRTRAEIEEMFSHPGASVTASSGAAKAAEPPAPALPPPTPEDLALLRQPLPPVHLTAKPGVQDFDLRGNAEQIFEGVAKAFGLECIFDSDYPPGSPIRFRVTGADYRTALHGLEAVTASFVVPLSGTRFLVAKDTTEKRNALEPVAAVEVSLSDAIGQQDLAEMVRAVQTVLAIEHVAQDTRTNTLILRDRVSKLFPARDLLESLKRPRGQVMFDVRLIEVSGNSDVAWGLTLPAQFPVMALSNWLHNSPNIPSTVAGLATFGNGKGLIGLGVADAASVATMSQSAGRVLLDSTVRTSDGLPASLHVGDRYPIITSIYSGTTTSATATGTSSGATNYNLPPAIQFEDLGLEMKVTPTIHGVDNVTLDVDASYKVLSGASVNGLPVISNRALKSQANLPFGDWAMVAGLLDSEEARSLAGIAGLSRIPFLGPLTSNHDHTKNSNDVLILIRPRLIAPPPSASRPYTFYLGADLRPISPL